MCGIQTLQGLWVLSPSWDKVFRRRYGQGRSEEVDGKVAKEPQRYRTNYKQTGFLDPKQIHLINQLRYIYPRPLFPTSDSPARTRFPPHPKCAFTPNRLSLLLGRPPSGRLNLLRLLPTQRVRPT